MLKPYVFILIFKWYLSPEEIKSSKIYDIDLNDIFMNSLWRKKLSGDTFLIIFF